MKINETKNKDSKLVFEPIAWRKLLKKNPVIEDKYCRYCGKSLDDNCDCPKMVAEIIDCKPYRDENGINSNTRSVMVFRNTLEFQQAYEQVMDEIKSKKEAERPEQLELCFD